MQRSSLLWSSLLSLCLACGDPSAVDLGTFDLGPADLGWDAGASTPDLGGRDVGPQDLGTVDGDSPLVEEITSFAQPFVDEGWMPGLSFALIDGAQTTFIGLGAVQLGGEAPAPDTLYEIGSITKTFTGLLLADAVVRGEVELEAPAQRYLPAQVSLPTFGLAGAPILLEHLSTHRSGLPSFPSNAPVADPLDPYADYTDELMYGFLNNYTLSRAPGAAFEYSNLAVGLLGHILAQTATTTYEALLAERVLAPLSLLDTAVELSQAQRARFAPAYDHDLEPILPWELGALKAAGALRSSARDMERYARAIMQPTALAQAIALAAQPRTAVEQSLDIGLGWFVAEGGGLLFHGGATGGYRAFLALLPGESKAVFVATNSGTYVLDGLGVAALSALRGQAYTTPSPRPVIDVDDAQLDALVGSYGTTTVMRVTKENNALYVQLPQQPKFKMYPESELRFYLRVVEASVEFVRDAGGQVTSLTLFQNGQQIQFPRL